MDLILKRDQIQNIKFPLPYIFKTVNTCLKSCDRRDLAMKADTGQIEPLEGVVQVSESLAKKPDIKIIVQV